MTRLTTKRITNLLSTLLFAFLISIGAFSMFSNMTIKISELENFKGVISNKGITTNTSNISGKGNITSNIFFIKLDGLNQILAVYNPSQNYLSIDSKLNIGDTIKVYFKSSAHQSRPNLNLYQIERNDVLVFDSTEFRTKERNGMIIAILGFIAIIIIGIFQDRRLRLGKT